MAKRIATTALLAAGILLSATQAQAQENWPDFFDGVNNMGPYAWLSPADAQSRGLSSSNAVIGGQAEGQSLALCRSPFPDGVHTGKLFGSNCHVGYGGQEVIKSSDFEVLYLSQPSMARFLSPQWVDVSSPQATAAFRGGQVGATPMRVARANYEGGAHPGKEWGGKCYIGYGGQEKALDPPYELLLLGFDRSAWQASQSAQTAGAFADPPTSPDPNTWPASFDGRSSLGPYAWVDGPTALQSDPQLANAVYGGQVGNTRQAVCRAQLQDGVHPGKYFNGQCNIGWGGREVALTTGYQVLVNTQPQQARYLTQRWNAGGEGFVGGEAGGAPLRVCQTWAADGTHLGKVWQGRCYYGWGGEERSDAYYGMLFLEFDKAAWQAANQVISNSYLTQPTVTLSTPPENVQVTVTTTNLNLPTFDPSVLENINLDYEPAFVVLRVDWAPGSMGKGFENVATYLPNLTYRMIDHYNATCTDPSLRRDRQEMYQAFKRGEVNTQAAMVLVMAEFAKNILNKSPDSLSVEEKSYARFLEALATDQRLRAGQEAMKLFQEWERQELEKRTNEGVYAMIDPLTNPPPEILAMAKSGYAVSPQAAENYMNVMAACSAPIAAGVGAGTVGVIAAIPGGVATVAGAIAPSVKIAISIGGSVARAIPLMSGLAGGIAVATLMIQAAIMKGIDVVKYEEYKVALNQAVADSQVPMTVDGLRPLLGTEEGLKTLASWLTAQAATGTTY
jgi:hypothetical protein